MAEASWGVSSTINTQGVATSDEADMERSGGIVQCLPPADASVTVTSVLVTPEVFRYEWDEEHP
ncbi:hypothetical protein [Paraliomyxa miuraensis]|uniref:hypothetical protein n=1 Tax=Paraliomyxa miuraensis TaxID=376150 RepID=UPI0022597643|nr:hypothetical protein [Paraliomyxa miuraensis]MCX4240695.1 hypothetical protein [Paraliomyxa miuraensis]